MAAMNLWVLSPESISETYFCIQHQIRKKHTQRKVKSAVLAMGFWDQAQQNDLRPSLKKERVDSRQQAPSGSASRDHFDL